MLENASQYRIDIQTDDNAWYFWILRNPQRQVWHKTDSFEDKQECLDNLTHVIIRRNFYNIPIFDENGEPVDPVDLELPEVE